MIITTLRAQLSLIKSGLFGRAGTIASLRNDALNLKTRALMIAERNNERANVLEIEIAEREQLIEQLDTEADEANLIAAGAARLIGE